MDALARIRKAKSNAFPICQHIKVNGIRCASPAVREYRYCYFHQSQRDLRRLRFKNPTGGFELPLLEDANSIQIALQDVQAAVIQGRMDQKLAGLLFFSLQIAQSNLKSIDFEPQQLRAESDPAQQSEVLNMLLKIMDEPPRYPASPDSPYRPATPEPDSGKKPAASEAQNPGGSEPAKLLAG